MDIVGRQVSSRACIESEGKLILVVQVRGGSL